MALSPLSTYMTWPVTPDAREDERKAATFPTSMAASSFWMGAFSYEYLCRRVAGKEKEHTGDRGRATEIGKACSESNRVEKGGFCWISQSVRRSGTQHTCLQQGRV